MPTSDIVFLPMILVLGDNAREPAIKYLDGSFPQTIHTAPNPEPPIAVLNFGCATDHAASAQIQIPHFRFLQIERRTRVLWEMIESGRPPDLLIVDEGSEILGDPPSPSEKRWMAEGEYLEPYLGRDYLDSLVSKVMSFLSVVRDHATLGGGIVTFLALGINNWPSAPPSRFRYVHLLILVAFDLVDNMHICFIPAVAEILNREEGSLHSFWGSIAIVIEINYINYGSRESGTGGRSLHHVDYLTR